MASFNHRVFRAIDAEPERFRNSVAELCRHGCNRKTNPGGCGKPIEFICMYDYVTGRAGNISDSRKGKCQEHAQAFAKNHGCDMPESS